MSSSAHIPWRRWANQGGLWNLFAWFGRSADQLAGLLLHPIALVVFARSVESDVTRISWFIGAFGLGWAAGYASAPLLQRLTVRVMPWIVGGYVVRAASVLLLAFAVSERSADADQRFRSALICYTAYAVASGIARSAQARHVVHGSAHGLWDNTSPLTTAATQVVIGLGALSLWSALSEPELPWSQAFGRVWYLASVALVVATLAAVQQGAQAPQVPRSENRVTRRNSAFQKDNRAIWIAITVALGASALLFVEGLAFLVVFEDFRRQSLMVRASVGFLAGGWVVGSVLWGIARVRYTPTLLAQVAVGLSMIGILLALSLNDLAAGTWFPNTIIGIDSVHFGAYAMAALIGAGLSGRRHLLNPIYERLDLRFWQRIALSLGIACAPIALAYATRDLHTQTALGAGLAICLSIVIALGALDRSGVMRIPRTRDDTSLDTRLALR